MLTCCVCDCLVFQQTPVFPCASMSERERESKFQNMKKSKRKIEQILSCFSDY